MGNHHDRNIRILIADDHEMIRQGVRRLVEQHESWHVCGEAATGREAVELATKLKPNVVILDLAMPELNGLEATRRIKKNVPTAEVMVFSIYDSVDLIHKATEAGARGYLLKSDLVRHITDAIEALAEHNVYFTSRVAKVLLAGFLDYAKQAPEEENTSSADGLSTREREVLQLLAEGHSNKSVAGRLNVGVKTVESHRSTIMNKLGIHSIAHLVRYAVHNEIILP